MIFSKEIRSSNDRYFLLLKKKGNFYMEYKVGELVEVGVD